MVTACGRCVYLMLMIDTHWYAWLKHTVAMCNCYLWLMCLLDLCVWCSWRVLVLGTPALCARSYTRGSWLLLTVGCTWECLVVASVWHMCLVLMTEIWGWYWCFVCTVMTCGWCSWLLLMAGCCWRVLEVDIYAWCSQVVLTVGVCCASWVVSIAVTCSWTPFSEFHRHWPLTTCLLWTVLLLVLSVYTNVLLFFFSKLQQWFFPPNFRYYRKYSFFHIRLIVSPLSVVGVSCNGSFMFSN